MQRQFPNKMWEFPTIRGVAFQTPNSRALIIRTATKRIPILEKRPSRQKNRVDFCGTYKTPRRLRTLNSEVPPSKTA